MVSTAGTYGSSPSSDASVDRRNVTSPIPNRKKIDRKSAEQPWHARWAMRQASAPSERKRQYNPADSESELYELNIDWCLPGDSQMARAVRTYPWHESLLGPLQVWPLAWKSALSMVLGSQFPMAVWLGESFRMIYNDAYITQLGKKHPIALGAAARDVYSEVWHHGMGTAIETVFTTGSTVSGIDERYLINRHGFMEETFWTGSHSALRDGAGKVVGVLAVGKESSARVITDRQLATLREIYALGASACSVSAVVQAFIDGIRTNPLDVPFALLYLPTLDQPARLCHKLRADVPSDLPSIFSTSKEIAHVPLPPDLQLQSSLIERPSTALYIPLSGAEMGVLVIGVNPYRRVDESYLTFAKLLGSALCSALVSSREYERERQKSEELAALNRVKTTFFHNVSHELRTPLTLLMGPLEEVLTDCSHAPNPPTSSASSHLTAHHYSALSTALRNSKRLQALVNTLLDFARLEAGSMQAQFRPTDIVTLTRACAESFRVACERAGLTLEVECESLHERAYLDHESWEKIVFNLVSNAYKFTLKGGIHVSLRRDDQAGAVPCALLQVRDTGSGIAASDLPRIFERFYRAPSSVGRAHEGSGIGLALVADLVRMHGGSVKAESIQGVCSVFSVRLPLGCAHLPAAQVIADNVHPCRLAADSSQLQTFVPLNSSLSDVPLPPPRALSGAPTSLGRILLADDNTDMRAYVSRLLLNAGYDVITARDGREALERLSGSAQAELPDLVISDVMMPRMDGRELLAAIRVCAPPLRDVPIIFLSAQALPDERAHNIELGAEDYLVKPFAVRELLTCVAMRLQRAAMTLKERVLREEAEQASAAKDRFLAVLSHELRTPLTPALMLAEAGKMDGALPATAREDFGTIAANIRLEVQLIGDLLDVTRIRQGKLELQLRPNVDLHKLLRRTVFLLQSNIREKRLKFDLHLSVNSALMDGDPTRLQQVFWNLIGNAIKFTPEEGSIKVQTFVQDGQCRVDVADTGVGLESADIPRIFNEFEQGGQKVTREFGGLGLGLAIAKTLVEMHAGHIAATSEGRGRGSVFSVTLPVRGSATASAPTAVTMMAPSTPTRSPDVGVESNSAARAELATSLHEEQSSALTVAMSVLVVDDNLSTLAVLCRMLQRLGHVPQAASSVAEAIRALRIQRFDVLICDWGLRDGTGSDVITAVKAQQLSLFCITLSGYGTDEDIQRSKLAGFATHLVKPISLAELRRTLHVAAASLR